MNRRILITGANRGLGLELSRQYAARGDRVFAACRQPAAATALRALQQSHPQQISIIQMDVTDPYSVADSMRQVRQHSAALDMLINNAGMILREADFSEVTTPNLRQTFEVNTIAPVLVTQHYIDLIKAGAAPIIVNITSRAGSIGLRQTLVNPSYAASKAALNMLSKMMANEFRPQGIIVVTVHPGWVQTDMGGPEADLGIEEAMTTMIKMLDSLTLADSGRFLQWDGEELPW